MTLNELFTHNYEYLNTVAKRITRCKDYRMAPELLSTTYLTLFEKQTVFPQDNEEFVKWFSKCMSNYFKWPNSDFNKTYNPKESLTLDESFGKKYNTTYNSVPIEIPDNTAMLEMEVLSESTNDFTKELIEISSSLGEEKTLRYIELIEFKKSLAEHEKILFELYFERELSTRDIAKLYSDEVHKMNYQSVNQMINIIKTKHFEYNLKIRQCI